MRELEEFSIFVVQINRRRGKDRMDRVHELRDISTMSGRIIVIIGGSV